VDVHKNAKLTPRGREAMVRRVVEHGLGLRSAAREFGVDTKVVRRWLARYREAGSAGLVDRSHRPHRMPMRTPAAIERRVVELRYRRVTAAAIAKEVGIDASTVSRIVRRHGLNRLSRLEPSPAVRRYEHGAPGSMLHLDIKVLARFDRPGHRVTGNGRLDSPGAGWEYVHVAIDDHARLAHARIHGDESAASAWRALCAALRYYRALGITIERVLTDNGPCYRSRVFARLCRRLGIKHRRTRAYTPRTNGKAERFIQTALREWAYAHAYANADQRARQLAHWLHHYNWHRPHGSLNKQPPVSRLGVTEDNLARLHI